MLRHVQLFATPWTEESGRLLEWVVISFSRGSSRPRDQTQISHIVSSCFTIWTTREVLQRYYAIIKYVLSPYIIITLSMNILPALSSIFCSKEMLVSIHSPSKTFYMWRWAWQLTPVFLPGKFHGQRSLVGYNPWTCKESDTN